MRRRPGAAVLASLALLVAACTQVVEPTTAPTGSSSPAPRPWPTDGGTPEPATGPATGVVATIELGQEVIDVLADPAGRDIYASGIGRGGAVWVIDAASAAVLQEVSIGGRPGGMAFDPSTGYLYVTKADEDEGRAKSSIVVVDTSLPAVVDEIELGPLVAGRLALDPDAGELYTLRGEHAADLVVIALATGEIVAEIPIADDLAGPLLDVETGRIFVGGEFTAELYAVDTASREVAPPVQVPAVMGLSMLTVDPDGGEVWVSEFEGPLDVYAGEPLELAASVDVGDGAESAVVDAVVDPSFGVAYVSQNRAGLILVVDTSSHEVVETVELGGDPGMLDLDPVRGRVYVVDRLGGELKVLGTGS